MKEEGKSIGHSNLLDTSDEEVKEDESEILNWGSS